MACTQQIQVNSIYVYGLWSAIMLFILLEPIFHPISMQQSFTCCVVSQIVLNRKCSIQKQQKIIATLNWDYDIQCLLFDIDVGNEEIFHIEGWT